MGQPSPAQVAVYDIGDLVRLSAQAVGTDGQSAVASIGIFLVKSPAGSVATYASDDSAASVYSDGSGGFEKLLVASQTGSWFYRFEATGRVVAADEWAFLVSRSFIL